MVDLSNIPPLDWQFPIVDPETGRPSPQFIRLWQEMFGNNSAVNDELAEKVPETRQIIAGAGLTGGGDLSADRTVNVVGNSGRIVANANDVDLATTAVTPGSYTSTNLTVDAYGRLTAASNGSSSSSFVGVKAYNAGTQSIANNTVKCVTLNSEEFDSGTMHDNSTNTSRVVAPSTGKYLVSYLVHWAGSNTTGNRIAFLRKNSAAAEPGSDTNNITGGTSVVPGNGSDDTNSHSVIVNLTASDYLELFVFQASGGSVNIGKASASGNQGSYTTLSMVYLGA